MNINNNLKLRDISRLGELRGGTTYPTLNVYLLAIGKASIGARVKYLNENPEYKKYYES